MFKITPLLRRLRERLPQHRVLLLCLAVVGASYAVRSFICHRELATIAATYRHLPNGPAGPFIPYLVESAMMFGYTQDVALGRGLPRSDHRLGGMEQLPTARQFTNGLEYFFGWHYRLAELRHLRLPRPDADQAYEDAPRLAPWLQRQVRLCASLVAGLIFLWLVALRCPLPLALLGGLLHAVAPAAIARYTGQDLVRGSLCLPLVTATFVLAAWHLRSPRNWKLLLLAAVSFLAFATWDMCQIVFGLWGVHELLRLLLGGLASPKRRQLWLTIAAAIAMAAILVPYHREHHLFASPLVLIVLPLVILGQHLAGRPWRLRLALMLGTALLCVGLWGLAASGMSANYGHFGSLLAAKLKFHNVKPPNPALLNFDARVLWTPAMHSADRTLLRAFFPMAIYGTLLLLAMIGDFRQLHDRRRRWLAKAIGMILILVTGISAYCFLQYRMLPALVVAAGGVLFILILATTCRRQPLLGGPIFLAASYCTAFFYIVRYHEFAALFLCLLLPLLAHQCWHAWRWLPARIALVTMLLLILWAEGARSLANRRSYEGAAFEEAAGLITWLRREGIEDRAVLADFGIGPALKAYCGAKIFLQPQFELPQVRDSYEAFVHQLFRGTERSLGQFCDQRRVELFVFDRGWGPQAPPHIYSARYMANAVSIPDSAPSVIMSHPATRSKMRRFYELKPPPDLAFISQKYLLFKVITSEDYHRAKRYLADAKLARSRGNLEFARTLAKAAVNADPRSYRARIMYAELFGRAAHIRPRGY